MMTSVAIHDDRKKDFDPIIVEKKIDVCKEPYIVINIGYLNSLFFSEEGFDNFFEALKKFKENGNNGNMEQS